MKNERTRQLKEMKGRLTSVENEKPRRKCFPSLNVAFFILTTVGVKDGADRQDTDRY